ncbi:MAG: hypothetical protein KGL25_01770 [Gammaproteobacteria bacterium]|nr:hypothetical protein [Gammaproteobacteria bacterium]
MTRILALLGLIVASGAGAAEPAPLTLDYLVPLGEIRGRIDHLAVDLARERLIVAELGNDSVGIVDLKARRVIRTIAGLKAPQGVGYESISDSLFVASAEDGSVRRFRGSDYVPAGRIDLGSDADNVRIDAARRQVLVGHSDGAITTIDAATLTSVGSLRLGAHPEGFQIDPDGQFVWVNVPDAHEVAVLDRLAGKQVAGWPEAQWSGNFPMALDREAHRLLVVFRHPAKLAAIDLASGKTTFSIDTCGDSDDVFVDARRHRLYVSCGEGYVDVLEKKGPAYIRIARISTVSGARTSYFSPELDRYFIAARAAAGTRAAIWVLKPAPALKSHGQSERGVVIPNCSAELSAGAVPAKYVR